MAPRSRATAALLAALGSVVMAECSGCEKDITSLFHQFAPTFVPFWISSS
jgi:hypothetical protein